MSARQVDHAADLDALAGGWGIPAAIQHTADRLPGSVTTHAAYDLSVGIGLLVGDLALLAQAVEEGGTSNREES